MCLNLPIVSVIVRSCDPIFNNRWFKFLVFFSEPLDQCALSQTIFKHSRLHIVLKNYQYNRRNVEIFRSVLSPCFIFDLVFSLHLQCHLVRMPLRNLSNVARQLRHERLGLLCSILQYLRLTSLGYRFSYTFGDIGVAGFRRVSLQIVHV